MEDSGFPSASDNDDVVVKAALAVSPQHVEEAVAWLTNLWIMDLLTSPEPEAKKLMPLTGNLDLDRQIVTSNVIKYLAAVSNMPASPGYEALLVSRGQNPLIARVKARVTRDRGLQLAKESEWRRRVVGALRFLGRPGRSRRAIAKKIRLIYAATLETRVIRTIFTEAGLSDLIFMKLLPLAMNGDETALEGILRIASSSADKFSVPRGPKISASSVAHESFLEKEGTRRAKAFTYSSIDDDFIDEATLATRKEFLENRFDPRPASRRLKARRGLAAS
jgi:hypothetical protein